MGLLLDALEEAGMSVNMDGGSDALEGEVVNLLWRSLDLSYPRTKYFSTLCKVLDAGLTCRSGANRWLLKIRSLEVEEGKDLMLKKLCQVAEYLERSLANGLCNAAYVTR